MASLWLEIKYIVRHNANKCNLEAPCDFRKFWQHFANFASFESDLSYLDALARFSMAILESATGLYEEHATRIRF